MPPALDTLVVMAFTACKALSPAVRAKRVTVELSRGEEGLAFESVSANKKGLDNPLMPDADYFIRLVEAAAQGLGARLRKKWRGTKLVLVTAADGVSLELLDADGAVATTLPVPKDVVKDHALSDDLLDALREGAPARTRLEEAAPSWEKGEPFALEIAERCRLVFDSGRAIDVAPLAGYLGDDELLVWPWHVEWLEALVDPRLVELANRKTAFSAAFASPIPCGPETARTIVGQIAVEIGARGCAATEAPEIDVFVAVG